MQLIEPEPRSTSRPKTSGGIMTAVIRIPDEHVRADGAIGGTREVVLTARPVDVVTSEVSVDGRVAGFIHREGWTFIASLGTSRTAAKECGRGQLWDQAAAALVEAAAAS